MQCTYTDILDVFGSRRVTGYFGKVFSLKLKSLDYHCGFKTGTMRSGNQYLYLFSLPCIEVTCQILPHESHDIIMYSTQYSTLYMVFLR